MSKLALLVSGRRSKFVVLGLWLLLAAALGPFAGKFESAQQNEPSSFLPGEAESVRVLDTAKEFPRGQATPAIVVYEDADGFDTRTRAVVSERRAALLAADIEGVTTVTPPVFSEDGRGALLTVPIVAGGDEEVLIDAVASIREVAAEDLPPALEV